MWEKTKILYDEYQIGCSFLVHFFEIDTLMLLKAPIAFSKAMNNPGSFFENLDKALFCNQLDLIRRFLSLHFNWGFFRLMFNWLINFTPTRRHKLGDFFYSVNLPVALRLHAGAYFGALISMVRILMNIISSKPIIPSLIYAIYKSTFFGGSP